MQSKIMFGIRLEPQGDIVQSMWDLIDRYDRNEVIPPIHQRDVGAWDMRKREAWVDRLANVELLPVGVIVTYQLVKGSPVHINDGLQRISVTSELKNFPEKYGYTKEQALAIIRGISITVQHRHYRSHEEAMYDFQGLNFGTHLTPYEFFAGSLRYMDNYEHYWAPLIEDLHSVINDNSNRILSKKRRLTKKSRHNYMRSDYGLFYRFISNDVSITPYKVASQKIDLSQRANGGNIERRLREEFDKHGYDKCRKQLVLFKKHIERETALIEKTWYQVTKEVGSGISMNMYRHLLDSSIWRRNLKIKISDWEDYLFKILDNSQGTAQVIDKQDSIRRSPVALNDLHKLGTICRIVGSDFAVIGNEIRKPKKNGRKTNGKPGWDESHLFPHGLSAETVFEPAPLNRARGARPMTAGEIETLLVEDENKE